MTYYILYNGKLKKYSIKIVHIRILESKRREEHRDSSVPGIMLIYSGIITWKQVRWGMWGGKEWWGFIKHG